MTQLQDLNITDFTGGLNLREGDFYLAQNESPRMLNVVVDERGGFAQRDGFARWNATDVVTPASWDPRSAEIMQLADGSFQLYVANGTTVYTSAAAASFSDLSVTVGASPHLADYAPWGDIMYMAAGRTNASIKRNGTSAASTLTDPAASAGAGWNSDLTTPAGGYMPKAELTCTHAGYLFVANIREDSTNYPNRIRWSHPDEPEDWREVDFIDIEPGGGEITGIISYNDHLVIFKKNSMWRLFGYDLESWQLEQLSSSVGAPHAQAYTRSERAIYFYSDAGRPGVYAYGFGASDGSDDHKAASLISEPLDSAFEEIADSDEVWVGYADRKLHVSIPWTYEDLGNATTNTLFVYDPMVGRGAWTAFTPARGGLRKVVETSDVAFTRPLAMLDGANEACFVVMTDNTTPYDYLEDASTTAERFTSEYSTPWIYGDWPERRKSWLRPKFLHRLEASDGEVELQVFKGYDDSAAARTYIVEMPGSGASVWNDGSLWGDGSLWNANPDGNRLSRVAGGFGPSEAIRMLWKTSGADIDTAWKIEAIFAKYVLRRLTT